MSRTPVRPESGGGAGAGKAIFQDLAIVHGIDKATPELLKACATGLHIKDATITHRKAGKGQQEFLIIKLNDVTITAVNHGGSEDQPYVESVNLKFAKVDLEYKPQRTDGSLDAGGSLQVRLEGQQGRVAVDPSEPRELTVDEAIALAIQLQQQHQLAEAEQLYARVLDVVPHHPDALHYTGLLAHQRGRTEEAISLIEESLALCPDQADWHSNLGIVLQSTGRLADAIAEYERAIAIDCSHANAHNNLGVLMRAAGRADKAEAAYRTAIRLRPDHVDAYTNLGILLNDLNRTKEASDCFCRAITLRPKHRDARRLLALAHSVLGETDKAVQIFSEWLAEEPGDPVAEHMLAAISGRNVPSRASNAFVKKTFDDFAATFEAKLQSLSYRAPELVAAALADSGVAAEGQLEILDLGCGTGLCGPLLQPYAKRLIGVDLSAGMLDHARQKAVYADLHQRELTEFLLGRRAEFDVMVSADTLVYFGDLQQFSDAAARALRPSGVLIFTLEHAAGEDVVDFRLESHGRYSHTLPYVQRVLTASGLVAEAEPAELRNEAGAPVAGLVVRATKPT